MTLSLRQRTALVLSGVMVTAPLWAMSMAAGSPTIVTFSGQPILTGAVFCPSTPSVGSITVAPGATVNFADQLGVAATLYAGDSQTHLTDGQMVPVTFGTGPTIVQMQMVPDCNLDLGTHGTMTVTVTPPPAGSGTTRGSGGAGGPTRAATPGASRSAQPPANTPKPEHTTPAAQPSEGGVGGVPGGPTRGAGSGALATPGPRETAKSGSVRLGPPVASDEPSRGASGLLTLIATVSLVGVSAAAIRAIVAQRASRALTA